MFILTLLSRAVFCLQKNVSDLFQFISLGIWNAFIRFHKEMKLISRTWYTFPQKSPLKIKTSKNRHMVCWWKKFTQNNYSETDIFLSLEKSRTFLLAKEKTWKRILTLTVNCCKIMQKKKVYYIFKSNKRVLHWVKE